MRGTEGMIAAASYARKRNIPYFGICFGMQMAVIEATRNLAGVTGANSTEFGPCDEPVVGLLTEWVQGNQLQKREEGGDMGGTMRLGAYNARLKDGSRIAEIYGSTEIQERHRHRYEVNIAYRDRLEEKGLCFAGLSPDGVLPETVELTNHPWYIGVQYHPELKSRPFEPHPLFRSFIAAAMVQSRLVGRRRQKSLTTPVFVGTINFVIPGLSRGSIFSMAYYFHWIPGTSPGMTKGSDRKGFRLAHRDCA